MILEALLLIQAAGLYLAWKAYEKRDEVVWAMSAIMSAILIYLSFAINIHSGNQMFTYSDTGLKAVNIGLFIYSIVFFFVDLLSNYTEVIEKWFKGKKSKTNHEQSNQ